MRPLRSDEIVPLERYAPLRDAYRERVLGERARILEVFKKTGMSPIQITNGSDYTRALLSYFRARARRT